MNRPRPTSSYDRDLDDLPDLPRDDLPELATPSGSSMPPTPGSRAVHPPYRRMAEPSAPVASAAPSAPPVRSDDGASRLVVGPNIRFKGEISSCSNLIVEGRVEASMDSERIAIADGGVFIGEAKVDLAEIAGTFEGKLVARQRLVLRAGGRLKGTVHYGELTIEPGGRIAGDVAPLDEAKS
jgi:cytoskeletal protein CcmA (bactofilin family)